MSFSPALATALAKSFVRSSSDIASLRSSQMAWPARLAVIAVNKTRIHEEPPPTKRERPSVPAQLMSPPLSSRPRKTSDDP